jgi:ribosomal protein L32
LDHFIKDDYMLAQKKRTTTLRSSMRRTHTNFSFQQKELQCKLIPLWHRFDEEFGPFRPILDYIALLEYRDVADYQPPALRHDDLDESGAVEQTYVFQHFQGTQTLQTKLNERQIIEKYTIFADLCKKLQIIDYVTPKSHNFNNRLQFYITRDNSGLNSGTQHGS